MDIIKEIISEIEKTQQLVSSGFYAKDDVLREIRKVSTKVDDYISSHIFKTKDKDTREELREILDNIVNILTNAEEQILEIEELDSDFRKKVNQILIKVKKELRMGLYSLHVTGEAQPYEFKIQEEINKELKKKAIVIPNEVKELGELAERVYQVLKIKKSMPIDLLSKVIEYSENEVRKIIDELEKRQIVVTVKKGNKEYVTIPSE